jgi:hypothetical protein
MTGGSFIVWQPRVFLALSRAQDQCSLDLKADPAALPFIEESQFM